MKAWIVFTLFGAMSVAPLLALPDQVGLLTGNNNVNSQRLEDLALNQAVWNGDDELIGQWEDLRSEDDTHTCLLKEPAIVFGVKADQVRASKQNGQLTAFHIGFRPIEGVAPTQVSLTKILQKNIEAYTGISPITDGDENTQQRFAFGSFVITLSPGFADAVDVSITPAPPKAAVAKKN